MHTLLEGAVVVSSQADPSGKSAKERRPLLCWSIRVEGKLHRPRGPSGATTTRHAYCCLWGVWAREKLHLLWPARGQRRSGFYRTRLGLWKHVAGLQLDITTCLAQQNGVCWQAGPAPCSTALVADQHWQFGAHVPAMHLREAARAVLCSCAAPAVPGCLWVTCGCPWLSTGDVWVCLARAWARA
jgi:hypothetical protein